MGVFFALLLLHEEEFATWNVTTNLNKVSKESRILYTNPANSTDTYGNYIDMAMPKVVLDVLTFGCYFTFCFIMLWILWLFVLGKHPEV